MARARRLCRWSGRSLADGSLVLAHVADVGRSDCVEHRATEERARGSRSARGYGTEHRALREVVARAVAAGRARCWRCSAPIHPQDDWHLGHDDHDRTRYRGPEHARCSVRAASAYRRAAS